MAKFTSPLTAKKKLDTALKKLGEEGAVRKQTMFYDQLAQRVRDRKAMFDELVLSSRPREDQAPKTKPPKQLSNKIAALMGKFEVEEEVFDPAKFQTGIKFQGRKAQAGATGDTEEKVAFATETISIQRGVVRKKGGAEKAGATATGSSNSMRSTLTAEELEGADLDMKRGVKLVRGRKEADVEEVDVALQGEEFAFEQFTPAMARSLESKDVLYLARMLYEYDGKTCREVSVPADAEVEIFELSEDGEWAFVRHGDQLGWVPMEFLQKVSESGVLNQFGEELGASALSPTMAIRSKVLAFLSSAGLFSEVRLLRELEVFVEDIDLLLKSGRTVVGTLAALLSLDDAHEKVDSFQALADKVKETREKWDENVSKVQSMLGDVLKGNASVKKESWAADRILMMSSAGGRGFGYLTKYLEEGGSGFQSSSEVVVYLAEQHTRFREETRVKELAQKEVVVQLLQRPDIQLFEGAYLDVDVVSLRQLLKGGVTLERLLKTLEELSGEGRTFRYFGELMGCVWELEMGSAPPALVTREYARGVVSSGKELSVQQKVEMVMRVVTHAESGLLQGKSGNIRVRAEDLQSLLDGNEDLAKLLCDCKLLNSLKRHFESFTGLGEAQNDPELLQLRKQILDQMTELFPAATENDLNMLFVDLDCFSRPLELLQRESVISLAPFSELSGLSQSTKLGLVERNNEREQGKQKILEYLSHYPMFKESVQVYTSDIESVLDAAGSGEAAEECMGKLRAMRKSYSSFAELVAGILEVKSK